MEENEEKDWKLKLKYGKTETSYFHFTILAEGIAENIDEDYKCPNGSAIMGMKAWATTSNQAGDMIQFIGENIGFKVTGKIEVYKSDAEEPPTENPYGYGINFTPFAD